MGFIPERPEPPEADDHYETGPIRAKTNVEGASVTRIRLDGDGRPVYGREVPIEFGFWARGLHELPVAEPGLRWSHRWLRLECRYEPAHLREKQVDPPTEYELRQQQDAVEQHRRVSAAQRIPPMSWLNALRKLGSMQRASGALALALATVTEAGRVARTRAELAREALAVAISVHEAASDDALARELLAECIAERAELLHELGRSDEAREALLEATEGYRSLLDDRPKAAADLVRSLERLQDVLEGLGREDERGVVLDELEALGSIRRKEDTLLVAEVPFGRRRCDRAVFRSGHDGGERRFTPKLKRVIHERVTAAVRAAEDAGEPSYMVNVPRIVLESLEDPKVLPRDPFSSNARIAVAGISWPNSPFWEPEQDYMPNWNSEEAARTGWVLGVCANAEAVHAKVMAALEPLVERAELGKLPLYPPGGRGKPLMPSGDRIGKPARELAPWAAWLAMAGDKEPVREGALVASVAAKRLNDLLYNDERKTGRVNKGDVPISSSKSEVEASTDTEKELIEMIRKTLNHEEHRRRVYVSMARASHEPWAQDGKPLVDRCHPRIEDDDAQIQALRRDKDAYCKAHAKEHRAEEVVDFVEDWLETVESQR